MDEDPSVLLAMAGLGQTSFGELAKGVPELLAEFRPLSTIRTAATFAGLLTQPVLQANCFRLEALVHLSLLYGERLEAPTKGFIRRAFDRLSEGYCGMQEDPAEDVFVALVNAPTGNWRVFEGIREGNAFQLQRIVSAGLKEQHCRRL